MSDGIQFNDEQDAQFNPVRFQQSTANAQGSTPYSLSSLVQKFGASYTQAQYILLSVGIGCIAISGFVMFHNVLGYGKAAQKIQYNIPDNLISKYPPEMQKQLMAAKK